MNKKYITHTDVQQAVYRMSQRIKTHANPDLGLLFNIYPVPRGGIPIAYHLLQYIENGVIVSTPEEADVIVDDLIDSGKTSDLYEGSYPHIPFFAAFIKPENERSVWYVFPWEQNGLTEETVEHNIVRILEYVGENPARGGLVETPARAAKAWAEWCSGYHTNPAEIFKVFDDGGEQYDQMIVVKDIPFFSHCEHHMAPFFGTATIAYIPNAGRIVGLSKLGKLVDCFAKRLQVQERLTSQIADTLMQHLTPLGVGVHIKARHLCMESRGLCKQGHHTETSAVLGILRTDPSARQEFIACTK